MTQLKIYYHLSFINIEYFISIRSYTDVNLSIVYFSKAIHSDRQLIRFGYTPYTFVYRSIHHSLKIYLYICSNTMQYAHISAVK